MVKLFKWVAHPKQPNDKWILISYDGKEIRGWHYNENMYYHHAVFTKSTGRPFDEGFKKTEPPEDRILKGMIRQIFGGAGWDDEIL